MKLLLFQFCITLFVILTENGIFASPTEPKPHYDPTWESLDSRPLPSWYDQGKLGIFIHWGVYAVPGLTSEWFWHHWREGSEEVDNFMKANYPPQWTYQDFGHQFTAEFYEPSKWAQIFQKSGAKYVVLTSKHHEGYTLWPSKYSLSWNSMDVGAHRDLVGELANAIREDTDLHFGLYHSLLEWYNPLYMADKQNEYRTNEFPKFKAMPELYELVNAYKPDIVWSDGDWESGEDYWESKEFVAWLYNESPVKDTVVTNDRWGNTTRCTHGGFYNCDDKFNPGVLQPHKWENCMTLDKYSWGYRRRAHIEDYLTPHEVITELVETVSCGGNLLLNVGPTKEGTIVPIQEERLLQLGDWLQINGQAIYETVPWTFQNDTVTNGVWYTSNPTLNQIYGITLNWPQTDSLHLASIDPGLVDTIQLFGYGLGPLQWSSASPELGIRVTFPRPDEITSQWAWTVVINQKF